MSLVSSTFFIMLGVVAIVTFHFDVYFPIWLSVAVLVFVSLYLFQRYRQNRLGILMLLLWLVYAIPFVHIPPYIWFDFNDDPRWLWGLLVKPYMLDERVISLTAMIGAVGGVGIALGASLNRKRIQKDTGINPDGSKRQFRTMPVAIWVVWVAIGVLLTALSAPHETIFTAGYTESESSLSGANFGSAWMLSYVILSFAFCDALLERKVVVKYLKIKIMLAAVTLVVGYFQLLRGDRESVPWMFGLILLYYFWAAGITQRRGFKFPWLKIMGVVFVILGITMVIGAVRSGLSGSSLADAGRLIVILYESETIGFSNLLHGTWSAALLTPLSVAGDHIYGLLPVKLGQDYANLFLSIIPGFLADAVGYIRPIDGENGPAWEMRYGQGGTHASVLPFMNFRMLGVFLVPAIWSFVLIRTERLVLLQLSAINLSLLVSLAMVSPHWLWYGEKNIMNIIIIWLTLSFFYRLSLGMFRAPGQNSNSSTNQPRLEVNF